MSGKLQSGEVSPTQSYKATDYDMLSTDTENQVDENSVDLVTTDGSDQMAPRTRSQSTKRTESCALLLPQSDSMFPSPAAASRNNAKRCSEDNHQPIQKRINQCVDNGPADELQHLYDRFRQEREYIDNRFSEIIRCIDNGSADGLRNLHERFRQEKEYIDHRFANERKRLDQKIDTLQVKISKGAKREKVAAEKITDDTIKSKWDTLRYNIRSVVLMLRSYEPKDTKHTLDTLRSRIPNASFTNLPKDYSREIFEGYLELYIWLFVYEDVFSGHGRQWRGNIFKLFQTTRQEVIDSEKDPKKLAELALWLSQGGEAVTSQLDKELQQPMADDFAESILAMFQPHQKPTHQAQIKEVLGVVVYDATELVKMFMSSKAFLLPLWPRLELLNRDSLATYFEIDHLPCNNSNERFLGIRPALIKYGNADGEKHDVCVTLCKPSRLYF